MANVTRIFAILLIALAVLLGAYAWMLANRPTPPARQVVQGPASFQMVVAAHDLPAGKAIDADALTVQMSPTRPVGVYGEPAMLVGRVPLTSVAANAPLLDANLATGLADAIAPGERAVAV